MLSSVASTALQQFSTLSHKRHDFGGKKNLLNTNCLSWFSVQLLSETFLYSKKKWARYDQKCIKVFAWSTRLSCPILMFHADRRTDRHDEANSRFSQFCESAKKFETRFRSTVTNSLQLGRAKATLYSVGFKRICPCCTQIFCYVDKFQHKKSAHNAVHRLWVQRKLVSEKGTLFLWW
jgi:hypothetical protein